MGDVVSVERLITIQVKVMAWAGSVNSLQSTLALITMRTEFIGSIVKCIITLLTYLIRDVYSKSNQKEVDPYIVFRWNKGKCHDFGFLALTHLCKDDKNS